MNKIKFAEIKQAIIEDYISILGSYDDFDDHTIENFKSCNNIEELINVLDMREYDAFEYVLGLIIED